MLTKGSTRFFALRVGDGTVFLGPAGELGPATDSWPAASRDFRFDLESALRAGAEAGRLRAAASTWGQALGTLGTQGTPEMSDFRFCIEVAEAVRTGRLAARFLPRFVGDARGPAGGAEEPFRRYQLHGAFPAAKPIVTATPKSTPTTRSLGPRQPVERAPTDFEDEAAQAKVLKQAARSGVPFCEICAQAAKSAA
jgi:hypothetical protein